MKTSISNRIRQLYLNARKAGHRAEEAYRNAKIVDEFNSRDDCRITAEPEKESYFDVFGEPDGYVDIHGRWHSPEQERSEIVDTIERLGCWIVSCECLNHLGEWEIVDSVGMNTGYEKPCNWLENVYVTDLMQSGLQFLEQRFDGV